MLEILAILWLSNANGRKAQSRGRKPGGFKALTIILWLGGELLGFLVGYNQTQETLTAYLYAIGFAIVGALLSRIIVSVVRPGTYRPAGGSPLPRAQTLMHPVTLTITREKSFVGGMVPVSLRLNGGDIGDLKNGDSLKARTSFRQNILVATDRQGNEFPPLTFAVAEGMDAHIYFQGGKFLDDAHQGILLLSTENVRALGEGRPMIVPDIVPGTAVQALPEKALPADAPKPRRVVLLLCAAFLCLLLAGLLKLPEDLRTTFVQLSRSNVALRNILTALLYGGSLYLFLQPKPRQWAWGLALLPLTALAAAFCHTYYYEATLRDALTSPMFRAMLQRYFIDAALVAAPGLLFSLLRRDGQRIAGPVWIAALLVTAYNVYLNRSVFFGDSLSSSSWIIMLYGHLQFALMLVMAAFYCRALCTLRSTYVQITGGARFWCILVAVSSTAAQIMLLANRATVDPYGGLLALVTVTGMLLLSANRRIGFQLALLGVGSTAMLQLYGLPQALYVNNFTPLGSAAAAGVNLLITWSVTYGARNNQNPRRTGVPRASMRPVHWVYKVAGMLDMLCGGFLLGMGIWSLAVQVRGFRPEPFFFGVVTGAVLLLFGFLCLRQSFRKGKRPVWPLLVIGLVFGILIALVLLTAAVIAIMDASR